jgi:hypothetical protein
MRDRATGIEKTKLRGGIVGTTTICGEGKKFIRIGKLLAMTPRLSRRNNFESKALKNE